MNDIRPYAVLEAVARELSDELSIVLSAIEALQSSIPETEPAKRLLLLEAERAALTCAEKAESLKLTIGAGPKAPRDFSKLADLVTPK